MTLDEISTIPKDRVVTYSRVVVDYRPQKEDPNRVRITADEHLINCPYKLTTRTSYLDTSKIVWNSTISTTGAKYMCMNLKNMYLATPLDRHEFMCMPFNLIPQAFIDAYNLQPKLKNGYIYMCIVQGLYMDYHKLAPLQTNYFANISHLMGTKNYPTLQVCGNIYPGQFNYL